MRETDAKDKWNNIYASQEASNIKPKAAEVLSEHACLLPQSGDALDMASGLGGNAILLAKHGLKSQAWDISQQANDALLSYCEKNNIIVNLKTRDLEKYPPTKNSFDVITVSYYLERSLSSHIVTALRQNGLLFYQTFIAEKVSDHGPKNPEYRLQENELLEMFSELHVLVYKEYGCVGNTQQGLRNVAQLVAQKR